MPSGLDHLAHSEKDLTISQDRLCSAIIVSDSQSQWFRVIQANMAFVAGVHSVLGRGGVSNSHSHSGEQSWRKDAPCKGSTDPLAPTTNKDLAIT